MARSCSQLLIRTTAQSTTRLSKPEQHSKKKAYTSQSHDSTRSHQGHHQAEGCQSTRPPTCTWSGEVLRHHQDPPPVQHRTQREHLTAPPTQTQKHGNAHPHHHSSSTGSGTVGGLSSGRKQYPAAAAAQKHSSNKRNNNRNKDGNNKKQLLRPLCLHNQWITH